MTTLTGFLIVTIAGAVLAACVAALVYADRWFANASTFRRRPRRPEAQAVYDALRIIRARPIT